MFIHGGYASGKTFLMGDFLKHYSGFGPVKFINIAGEDGYMSAQSFGLGEVGETAETFDDFVGILNDCKKDKVVAVGVDSMKALAKLVMGKVLGTFERQPEIGGKTNEWSDVHFKMELLSQKIRHSAT